MYEREDESTMTMDTSLETLATAASLEARLLDMSKYPETLGCEHCDAKFVNSDALFHHWLIAHCRLESRSADSDKKSSSSNNKTRRKRDSLMRMKKSSRRSGMECGSCRSSVRSVTSFFLHWLEVHASKDENDVIEEVWQCSQCQPTILMQSRESLLGHLKSKHRESKENEDCNKCSESLQSSQSLRSHLAEDHHCYRVWKRLEGSNSGDNLEFVISNKSASREVSVNDTASEEDEEPMMYQVHKKPSLNGTVLKCRGCQLTFTSTKLLEKHFQANHDFQCKFCNAKMDKDLYGEHLRTHLAAMRNNKAISGTKDTD